MEMEGCSLDLEIDVNGEEIFMVDKRILSFYSARINKLVGKSKGHLKLIFNDFPGGAATFELIIKFCYNGGNLNINPLNISNLNSAAHFMEMNKPISGTEKPEKSLQEIRYWTWSQVLVVLKEGSSLSMLHKCLESLVSRISSSCEMSPCCSTSSSESSVFRLSCDTRSTESSKNASFRTTWWFEDLVSFDPVFIRMLVKLMVSRSFDHGVVSRFLFFYMKSRFGCSVSMCDKVKIVEMVVETLDSLDSRSVSYKSLFGMMRVCSNMKLSQLSRDRMESMIGSQLDQATLDNVLIPSPAGKNYLYDVDLVLRFVKAFVGKEGSCVPSSRLKKVARLIDLYLAEVAPDPHLKPLKFLALIRALPDSSRDSCDGVYYALDLYLEVHSNLSEEQKMKVCCSLNYEKLSSDAFNHLTRNPKFPSKSVVQAAMFQQQKLKNLLQDTTSKRDEGSRQIVLYAKKFNLRDENMKLKARLQGMQSRVVELEKVCRKMQVQMSKIMKSRISKHNAKSVPKLCSYSFTQLFVYTT